MELNYLIWNRKKCLAIVNIVLNNLLPQNAENILNSCRINFFLKKDLCSMPVISHIFYRHKQEQFTADSSHYRE